MRPTALTVICVIGLCLAGIGLMVFCLSSAQLALFSAFSDAILTLFSSFMPPQQAQQQRELIEATQAVARRWLPVQIGLLALHLATIVLLAVGCIKGLRLSRGGHQWLVAAMICGIGLELARLYPNVAIQRETEAVTMRHMNQALQGQRGTPPQARAMMTSMVQFSRGVGLLFIGGMLLLKLGFYGGSLWYVLKPDVKRLFEPEPVLIELVDDARSEPPLRSQQQVDELPPPAG